MGDLLVKLCTAPLPIPSHAAPEAVPPGFDAWFAKALTREPEGRFSSASELAESLGAVCGLSVRGAYATGDIPIPSLRQRAERYFIAGHDAWTRARSPPHGIMPVTPYPHRGPHGPQPGFQSKR